MTTAQGVTSDTSVAIDLSRREMVILGTQYAGEMKKGVFTILNYLAPKQALSLLPFINSEAHFSSPEIEIYRNQLLSPYLEFLGRVVVALKCE